MSSDSFADNDLLCGISYDLTEELFHFGNRRPWQSGLFSKLLVKADDLRVLLIAMDAGARMEEHHTDGPSTIHVLQGMACISVQEKRHNLRAGVILTLAPGTMHAIEAVEASVLLLTIAWPTSDVLRSLPHRGYGS